MEVINSRALLLRKRLRKELIMLRDTSLIYDIMGLFTKDLSLWITSTRL